MSESDTVDWRSMPADPDPDDLGYDPLELDITESSADGGHYVILPHDEEFLREACKVRGLSPRDVFDYVRSEHSMPLNVETVEDTVGALHLRRRLGLAPRGNRCGQ